MLSIRKPLLANGKHANTGYVIEIKDGIAGEDYCGGQHRVVASRRRFLIPPCRRYTKTPRTVRGTDLLPEADEHPRLLCAAPCQVGRHDDIAIRADATGVYIATRLGKRQYAG
jgi:hypothetical protein